MPVHHRVFGHSGLQRKLPWNIRRDALLSGIGILHFLQPFGLIVELEGSCLQNFGIIIGTLDIIAYGSVIICRGVAVFFENRLVEQRVFRIFAGADIGSHPLVSQEHIGINFRHGLLRNHLRAAA